MARRLLRNTHTNEPPGTDSVTSRAWVATSGSDDVQVESPSPGLLQRHSSTREVRAPGSPAGAASWRMVSS